MVAACGNLFIGAMPLNPANIAIVVCAVAGIVLWMSRGLPLDAPTVFAVGTAVALLPAILAAPATDYAQSKITQTIATIGIGWFCAQILSSETVRRKFYRWIVVGGAATTAGILLFGEYNTFNGRVSYFALNPIGIGRMTSYAGLILFLYSFHKFPRVKVLGLAIGAVFFAVAAATGSRAPLGAAIIALLIVIALRAGSLLSRALALGAALVALFLSFEITQAESGGESRLGLSSLTGRDLLWSNSFKAFSDNPWGLGIGNLRSAFPAGAMNESDVYSHNLFLEAATEGGVILLAWIIVFVILALKRSLKDQGALSYQAATAMLIATLVNAQFSSDFVGNRLMWVMMFIAIAMGRSRNVPDEVGNLADTGPIPQRSS